MMTFPSLQALDPDVVTLANNVSASAGLPCCAVMTSEVRAWMARKLDPNLLRQDVALFCSESWILSQESMSQTSSRSCRLGSRGVSWIS
jgi:hypothetical protein